MLSPLTSIMLFTLRDVCWRRCVCQCEFNFLIFILKNMSRFIPTIWYLAEQKWDRAYDYIEKMCVIKVFSRRIGLCIITNYRTAFKNNFIWCQTFSVVCLQNALTINCSCIGIKMINNLRAKSVYSYYEKFTISKFIIYVGFICRNSPFTGLSLNIITSRTFKSNQTREGER